MPTRRRNRGRKFSFVLDNACDNRTKPIFIACSCAKIKTKTKENQSFGLLPISITLHRNIGLFVTGLFQNIQERTKALVFVFVLVDEQAIINYFLQIKISEFLLHCRCIKVAESKLFEYFILVTIVATCFSLALSTPYPNGDSDDLNATLVSAGCRQSTELITG